MYPARLPPLDASFPEPRSSSSYSHHHHNSQQQQLPNIHHHLSPARFEDQLTRPASTQPLAGTQQYQYSAGMPTYHSRSPPPFSGASTQHLPPLTARDGAHGSYNSTSLFTPFPPTTGPPATSSSLYHPQHLSSGLPTEAQTQLEYSAVGHLQRHSRTQSLSSPYPARLSTSQGHMVSHARAGSHAYSPSSTPDHSKPPSPNAERPHRCDQCPMAFSRSHDLKRHKDTHTGERNHVCVSCNKSFTRKDALKRHVLVKQCGA